MWRIRGGQSEAAREVGSVVRSDVSVSIDQIADLLAEVSAFVEQQGTDVLFLPFNFAVPSSVVETLRPRLLDHLFGAVERRGGSISAEHGVGRTKRQAIQQIKSPVSLNLMTRIRDAIDPQRTLNADIGLV
jgi:FAD/FMN-containing dehydrogenase